MLSKQQMAEVLRENVMDVTFTKVNGEQRVMSCTLRPDVVIQYEKKSDRVKVSNEDILPVWDVDAEAWRSFHVSKVTDFDYKE